QALGRWWLITVGSAVRVPPGNGIEEHIGRRLARAERDRCRQDGLWRGGRRQAAWRGLSLGGDAEHPRGTHEVLYGAAQSQMHLTAEGIEGGGMTGAVGGERGRGGGP